jgi:hypothetical protein
MFIILAAAAAAAVISLSSTSDPAAAALSVSSLRPVYIGYNVRRQHQIDPIWTGSRQRGGGGVAVGVGGDDRSVADLLRIVTSNYDVSNSEDNENVDEYVAELLDDRERQPMDDSLAVAAPGRWMTSFSRSAAAAGKRSAWLPSEIRLDKMMEKLRSRMHGNREKHSVSRRSAGGRGGEEGQRERGEGEQRFKRGSRYKRFLTTAGSKTFHRGQLQPRNIRDVHPDYLGLGPEAARKAYGVFAGDFLADEQKSAGGGGDGWR